MKFINILIASVICTFLGLYDLAWCLWTDKDPKVLGSRIKDITNKIIHLTD
jgi:hypothetical protein